MNENLKHDTYLLISEKQVIISVNSDINKNIYLEESNLVSNSQKELFEKLDMFLNNNVFKIEKKLKDFIKKISIILDLDIFFPIEISIKKNINDEEINTKILNYLVYEAKESCKKTLEKKKIVHMFINNFKIDNQNYPYLPDDIKGKNLSLDIKFITISVDYIKELEKILKKYQISLNKVLNLNYLKQFMSQDEPSVFSTAKKIADGFNINEVTFIEKSVKKQGFFEKFFNFFN